MMKLEVLDTRQLPSIHIPQRVLYDIEDICAIHDKWEVGWMGEAVFDGANNRYIIGNVYIPDQEVHATTTEISTDGLMELDEDPDLDSDIIRYWGHSHVNMGVTPSGQDDDTMRFWATMVPDFYVGTIHNKDGKIYGYLIDTVRNIYYKDVPVHIMRYDGHVPTRDWKELFDKNVSQKKYSAGFHNKGYANSHKTSSKTHGKTSSSTKQGQAKTSTNTSQKLVKVGTDDKVVHFDGVDVPECIKNTSVNDWLKFAKNHTTTNYKVLEEIKEAFGDDIMSLLPEFFFEGPSGSYYVEHSLPDNEYIALEIVLEGDDKSACWLMCGEEQDACIISPNEFEALQELAARGDTHAKYKDTVLYIKDLNLIDDSTGRLFSLINKRDIKSYINTIKYLNDKSDEQSVSDKVVTELANREADDERDLFSDWDEVIEAWTVKDE